MGKEEKQALQNAFYDCANFVQIGITMDDAAWQALKAEQPAGGTAESGQHHVGPRYQWHTATAITITIYNGGAQSPETTLNYSNVAIKKKSWWGSFSTSKPSLRLDVTKYNAENNIENDIGSSHLMFNNSIQDSSYLRQPVGYALLRMCGAPAFRCNLASVSVNGEAAELYVNIEPFGKRFVKNDANGFQAGDRGNGYELEVGDDLSPDIVNRPGYVSFEGFSKHSDKADVTYAAAYLASDGISAMSAIVNMDEFLRFMALECLLRHSDGYCNNRNNTFLYNDSEAVATPGTSNMNLKLIISGIDQTCRDGTYSIYSESLLASLVVGDTETKAKLATVFSELESVLEGSSDKLLPVWDPLKAYMSRFGFLTGDLSNDIDAYLALLPTDKNCQSLVQVLNDTNTPI